MTNTFLNWDTDFKVKYPFSGHIDIDITGGYINCKLFYNRPHGTFYLLYKKIYILYRGI